MSQVYSIYQIVNKVNGKVYIGWTCNPERRWLQHKNLKGCAMALRSAIKYHGTDNFTFKVLYQSKDGNHVKNEMEPYYIKLYESFGPKGYNLTAGGEGMYGFKHKQSTKDKWKKERKGKSYRGKYKMSDQQKKAISQSKVGKKHSLESRKNMGLSHEKTYTITKQSGETMTFKGLNDFCRTQSIYKQNGLWRMISGKANCYKDIIKITLLS